MDQRMTYQKLHLFTNQRRWTWTGDFKCRKVKTGFCQNRSMQTGSSGTLIGWKSGQTTFVPLWDWMEGAWLRTQNTRGHRTVKLWIPRETASWTLNTKEHRKLDNMNTKWNTKSNSEYQGTQQFETKNKKNSNKTLNTKGTHHVKTVKGHKKL